MIKKLAVLTLTAAAFAAVPVALSGVAQAEVCGDAGGRHVAVGGCTNIGGDIADAAIVGAAVDHPYGYGGYGYGYPPPPPMGWPPLPPGYLAFPSFPGEAPCYLPSGQPYYTPGTMPCY